MSEVIVEILLNENENVSVKKIFFSLNLIENMDFHVFFNILWSIPLIEPMKNTLINTKIHNFVYFFKKHLYIFKKNRLAAGSLPGVTLGGECASGSPLRGG